MKLVLDTDVLVDHLRLRDSPWIALLEDIQRRRIGGYVSVITLAELHAGSLMAQAVIRTRTRRLLSLFRRVPVQEEIAIKAGALLREHVRDGLALADALVAATALSLDAPLVTRNRRHYQLVRGLRFYPIG